MARLARVVAADVPHHVTQRGNARRFVPASDTDRIRFVIPRTVHEPSAAGQWRLLLVGLLGLRFTGRDRIRVRRLGRVRRFRLLRWTSRTAIAKVLHLLRAQGTTGVNRLNRALLLHERRLHRCRRSFANERAWLFGWPRRGPDKPYLVTDRALLRDVG